VEGGSVVVGVVRGLYDDFTTPSKKKAKDYGAGGGPPPPPPPSRHVLWG